jgi:hypothetical protein
MFKKLREALSPPPVTLHPQAFVEASLALQKYWVQDHEITKDFTQEFIDQQANGWASAIVNILQHQNALQLVRSEIVSTMYEFGRLQVLVIDAPPLADQSGFRGWLGITGELKRNLDVISESENELRGFLLGAGPNLTLPEKWNAILFRYRILWAQINILNALRKPLGDVHLEIGSDWFWPLICIYCCFHETNFRANAGLPITLNPSIDDALEIIRSLLSLKDLILSESKFPDLEWEHKNNVKLPRYTAN